MGILRKIRRAMHPVRSVKSDIRRSVRRTVVPKPIRELEHGVFNVAHPIEAAESAAFSALDRAVTPKKSPKPQRKPSGAPADARHVNIMPTGTVSPDGRYVMGEDRRLHKFVGQRAPTPEHTPTPEKVDPEGCWVPGMVSGDGRWVLGQDGAWHPFVAPPTRR